jgi:hypothetical protein
MYICKRKANWIGHILHRNCLLQWVIEGKIKGGIEMTGRRGRRHRNLLDDLRERRGYSHLKEEALNRTMWCWRRMEKIIWTDRVRNEEVLVRVKEQWNILHEISKRKANWIGHILCRNCLLQWVIEGKIKWGI